MQKTFSSPAKINLGLSIKRKLHNNYHEIETIYCQVNLYDFLTFQVMPNQQIIIKTNHKNLPINQHNLINKAAKKLQQKASIDKGIKIFLDKNIPLGSGLGGGSSNAATTLMIVNKLWNLNYELQQLISIAKQIGSDVAYHLVGGVAYERQGGNQAGQFTQLANLPECWILICFPQFSISSQSAFQNIDYQNINKTSLNNLIKSINEKNLDQICHNLHNDFEIWTLKQFPLLKKIKKIMKQNQAKNSLLSGKGSCIFAFFLNKAHAQKASETLKKSINCKTFLVQALNK